MTSNLTAAANAAHTNTHTSTIPRTDPDTNTTKRRHIAIALITAAVLLMSSVAGALFAFAGATAGINGNGTNGVYINIYGPYYKALANETSAAYGRGGCAWYASSRASELAGKNLGVHSPANWWNTYAAQYGFRKTSYPVAKGFAVFSNHMAVIEKVEGNTLTISEGSNPGASDAAHAYCAIRQVNRTAFEKSNYGGQSFRGYIDLGYRVDNPPRPETRPADTSAVYIAQGSTDNKWHAYRGSTPDYGYTGITKGLYGWWKTYNGTVDFGANGVFKNAYGWWKVTNGKVDFSFTGIASNEYGTWYLIGGKVDFSFSGDISWAGRTWSVNGGKAVLK
ncbi:MAG: hypothetical protein ILO43_07260 [Clostridia bacterium]|nr:hypothetical protein [Clostridia bacterium]